MNDLGGFTDSTGIAFADPASSSTYTQHAQNTENRATNGIWSVAKPAVWVTEALTSGAASLWNSAINVGKLLSTEEEAKALDKSKVDSYQLMGDLYGKAWQDFYGEHAGSIDFGGEVASLFVPGSVALKLTKLARAGIWGVPRLLGGAEKIRETFAAGSKAAELTYGNYDAVWKATSKAYLAAGAHALGESAAATAVSYAMLSDSRMFDDYSITKFGVDTLLGGALIAPFKLLATRAAAKEVIGEFETRHQTANGFIAVDPKADPIKNIVQLFSDRQGKAFSDDGSARQFKAILTREFYRVIPEKTEEANRMRELLRPIVHDWADAIPHNPDAGTAIANVFAGVKQIGIVDPTQTFVGRALSFLTEEKGLLKQLSSTRAATIKGAPSPSDLVISFGSKDFSNSSVTWGGKKVPISNEKAQEFYNRLSKDRGGRDAMALDASANLQLHLDPRDIYFSGNVFNPNEMVFLRTRADLEGLKLGGAATAKGEESAAALALERMGNNLHGFLNLFTREVTHDMVASAGDAGWQLARSGVAMENDLQKGKLLLSDHAADVNLDLLSMQPHEADALHVLAAHIGKNAELTQKVFALSDKIRPYLKAEWPPNSGSIKRWNYAFQKENLLALEAADFEAARETVAPIRNLDGELQLWDRGQIQNQIKTLKEDLISRGIKRGWALDEIEGFANTKIKDAAIDPINQYAGKNLAEALAPRHVQLSYDLGGLPSRDELIAGLTQKASEEVLRAHAQETVGRQLSKWMNTDLLLDVVKKIDLNEINSESGLSGFLNFAQGTLKNATSTVLWIGSQTREAITGVKTKWQTQLSIASKSMRDSPYEMGQFNVIKNHVSARPNVLKIAQDADGKWRLWNTKLGAFERVESTGQLFPEIGPKQLRYLQVLQNEIAPDYIELHNANVELSGQGEKIVPGTLFMPSERGQFYHIVKFADGGRAYAQARSETDLVAKLEELKKTYPDAQVISKKDVEWDNASKGLFNDDHFIEDVQANNALAATRTAIPPPQIGVGPEGLDSIDSFYNRAAEALVRRSMQGMLTPEFRQLKQMQERFSSFGTSIKGKSLPITATKRQQPFTDAINTMLDRSLKSDFPLWDSANNYVAAATATAYEGIANFARTSWPGIFSRDVKAFTAGEEAKKLVEYARATGINTDFTSIDTNLNLTRKVNPQIASQTVAAMNRFFVSWQLGRDPLNTVVNVLSWSLTNLPEFRSLQRSIMEGKISGTAVDVAVPGSEFRQATFLKLVRNAGMKFLNPAQNKETWDRLVRDGIVSRGILEYQQEGENVLKSFGLVARDGEGAVAGLKDAWGRFSDSTAKWLVKKPNEMMQFISADVADQLFLAAGSRDAATRAMKVAQFVKRTQHNFPFAQRPIIFQGPVGSAISLYQTFVFNTLQNLARYAGQGDKAALGAFFGLQSGIFGLQSNPIFHAVNTAIAYREGNNNREDIYSQLNDPAGDWLLYGGASNLLKTSIWARGDITPRSPIILPTSTVDIPAISQSIRAAKAIGEMIRQTAAGGVPIATGALLAIQHSGLSRPLAGVAAMLSGQTTDANGNMISDANFGFQWATLARVMGGRPFDEGKLVDLNSRITGYKLKDRALVEQVGRDIKAQIQGGQTPSSDTIKSALDSYLRAGGQAREFSNFLREQTEKATKPLAGRLQQKYSNDPDLRPAMDFLMQEGAGG